MNEKSIFYIITIVIAIGAFCWFSTSHIDERRSEDVRARISDSETINTELQGRTEHNQDTVRDSIQRLGSAEEELNRAASAIDRCQQILGTAQQRAQEADKSAK